MGGGDENRGQESKLNIIRVDDDFVNIIFSRYAPDCARWLHAEFMTQLAHNTGYDNTQARLIDMPS